MNKLVVGGPKFAFATRDGYDGGFFMWQSKVLLILEGVFAGKNVAKNKRLHVYILRCNLRDRLLFLFEGDLEITYPQDVYTNLMFVVYVVGQYSKLRAN